MTLVLVMDLHKRNETISVTGEVLLITIPYKLHSWGMLHLYYPKIKWQHIYLLKSFALW